MGVRAVCRVCCQGFLSSLCVADYICLLTSWLLLYWCLCFWSRGWGEVFHSSQYLSSWSRLLLLQIMDMVGGHASAGYDYASITLVSEFPRNVPIESACCRTPVSITAVLGPKRWVTHCQLQREMSDDMVRLPVYNGNLATKHLKIDFNVMGLTNMARN